MSHHPPKPNSERSEHDSKLHDQNNKNQDPHHFFHEKSLVKRRPSLGVTEDLNPLHNFSFPINDQVLKISKLFRLEIDPSGLPFKESCDINLEL